MLTTYIGFDIETTSTDPNKGEILTLGAVNFQTGAEKYLEFRHQGLWIVPQAIEVNKIDVASLHRTGVPYDEGDSELLAWLNEQSSLIKALGLNVGSFDIPYLKGRLPLSYKRFGYRFVDINSLLEARALVEGKSFDLVSRLVFPQADEWAKAKKPELHKHHALYDCYTACYAFALLTDREQEWMALG